MSMILVGHREKSWKHVLNLREQMKSSPTILIPWTQECRIFGRLNSFPNLSWHYFSLYWRQIMHFPNDSSQLDILIYITDLYLNFALIYTQILIYLIDPIHIIEFIPYFTCTIKCKILESFLICKDIAFV